MEYAVESVRDAMLTIAVTHAPDLTVAEAGLALANPKVHMVLLTEGGRLLGTLVEDDLVGAEPDAAARPLARLSGRTVAPDQPLDDVHRAMVAAGQRRLAVADEQGSLLGLLCLKRHLGGFCSDDGVAERRQARRAAAGRKDLVRES